MTLYYMLVFVILCLEITSFLLLMAPVPYSWKKKVFMFLSSSPEVARIRYILKIVFGFIFLLFVDSINRLNTLYNSLNQAAELEMMGVAGKIHNAQADAYIAAKKFYAQRNLYLTGFTLLLTLILNHTTHLTIDVIRLQDEKARLMEEIGSTTQITGSGPAPIVGLEETTSDKKKD